MVDVGKNLVWVVDDSDACRRLLVVLAQRARAAVQEFTSAQAALNALATSTRPAAVLTDLNMPHQSGLDLIRALRAAGFTGPVALITASSDDETRAAAQTAGATAVLSKFEMSVSVPWFIEIALRSNTASAA